MALQITGKNLDIGDAYRSYVQDRIDERLEKFLGDSIDGSGVESHIRLEKEGDQFRTNCSLTLSSGLQLQSHGESGDAYASTDAAIERLEKRLRRYKRRLKEHHNNQASSPAMAAEMVDYVVESSDTEDTELEDNNPVIVAETRHGIHSSTVSDAVMQLDVSGQPILMFKNAKHGRINVVYRRTDGNIGWIDPEA